MVTATEVLTQAQYNAAGQSSWTTNSISPTAGKFVIVTVTSGTSSSTQPNIPSISGCNMTFTQVATYVNAISLSRRLTVYRAVATNPSAGALTISFAGQNQVGVTCLVVELTGIDTTGTNGSNGVVQAISEVVANNATSKSMTLSALAKPDNVSYGAIMTWGYSTSLTPGSGYTEINETVNTVGSITQNQIKSPLGSTTVNWTFNTNNDNETAAIAMELKTVPDTGGLIFTLF